MERAPLLEVRNICKAYPDGWTMVGVGFAVSQGENVCILGPSGCGKTTLLRLLAGLESADCGQVLIGGVDVATVPPHRRGMGLMFQEYALFPHRDVIGNVAFGLRMQGLSHSAVERRVAEVLQLVGLAGLERRDVNQLSGGERQRVALARSLAPQPRLLMLDEPLGSLDRALRERLLDELPRILQRAGVTAITVTHDQEEAFAIADRLVLMHAGRIVQTGTPEAVYERPASAWVARFLGLSNLLAARVVAQGHVETNVGLLRLGDAAGPAAGPGSDSDRQVLIRPEAAHLADAESGRQDRTNYVTGVVVDRSFRGGYYQLTVRHASGTEITFSMPNRDGLPLIGEEAVLSLDPQALVLLPPE